MLSTGRLAVGLDTRDPKRGGERRGQNGPPEEALAPEGQSRRNEEILVISHS
jgi:hypothetical protein